MSAVRLPLLCAFAGGCLSNALLFGVWRAAQGASGPSVAQVHTLSRAVELVPAASVAPGVGPAPDQVAKKSLEPAQDAETDPALAQPAQAVTAAGAAPVGSSVSDVLTRLEEAYRARQGAMAAAEPDPATPAPMADVRSAIEPARGRSTDPASPVSPVVSNVTPAVATTPAALLPAAPPAASPPPATVTPAAVLPVVEAPQLAAAPAAAAPDSSRPSEVHYGDVNQNTYITNVRQGDVYQIQLQQLVLLQYLQQLAVPSAYVAPGRHVGGAGHPRSAPFSSGITNPDNPWGFHFAPPNLVR